MSGLPEVPGVPGVPGLPALAWTGAEGDAAFSDGVLTLRAAAGVDWINDAAGGPSQHDATALTFPAPDGDFLFSARVRVPGERTTFDAGVLTLWSDPDHWVKLCNEWSPDGEAMVVSVVTDGSSDDSNAAVLRAGAVHLRLGRTGPAAVLHRSDDGVRWEFVRTFRLAPGSRPWRLGFLAQAQRGEACVAAFDAIRLEQRTLADARDGS